MTTRKRRSTALTTHDLYNLDAACQLVAKSFGPPYLVGSVNEGTARPPWRDVDVRLMLDDAEFDALFGDNLQRWELLSLAIGDYLRQRTGLPIDFQIQRRSEANKRHAGKARNPLGLGRDFAGMGDGTNWKDSNDRR